jgi:hypothetical protein
MKLSAVLTLVMVSVAILLSSCRTPPPMQYDRPQSAWKNRITDNHPGKHRH